MHKGKYENSKELEAVERGRAKVCLKCPHKKCINCYENYRTWKQEPCFKVALTLGIPETIARKMFRNGDLL